MRHCLTLAAFLFAIPAVAQTGLPPAPYADQQLADPAKEAAARDLMDELRCLKCQSQSIADSNAPMAGDMRSQVRERIAAGESPEQIRAWLVERYGNWVSYDPPMSPLTWPLWIAPIFLLLAALWLARGRFRRKKDKS
ncbi:MAG: cytochrome c-type biogenesis protein [Parasphingorhabdus sp.]|uniref:cytochrome c-type biogenesis protein n=1 Tax=Parasphingorhabdus sp. TaxID=2709688 RepID=UPI003002C2FA